MVVGILLQTVDSIIGLTGKENNIHEKIVVSVDGKMSCGSGRKDTADRAVKALQTSNVYSNDYGICLVQKFIEEKQMKYR